MKKPTVDSSDIVYSGFFDVRKDILRRSDGLTHSYHSLLLKVDAVSILGQTSDGKWILNREYRHATGKVLLGPPGGRMEAGEDPLKAAEREFFEETGYRAEKFALLGCSYPFPGVCEQKIYHVAALKAYKVREPQLDPFEFLETELKSDEELEHEIRTSDHIDGILLISLFYWHLTKGNL